MNILREVTVWDSDIQPNHIYLVDGDYIIAYVPKNTSTPIYLETKMRLNKRGRKFEKLKSSVFDNHD
jgi:hypothetical protein